MIKAAGVSGGVQKATRRSCLRGFCSNGRPDSSLNRDTEQSRETSSSRWKAAARVFKAGLGELSAGTRVALACGKLSPVMCGLVFPPLSREARLAGFNALLLMLFGEEKMASVFAPRFPDFTSSSLVEQMQLNAPKTLLASRKEEAVRHLRKRMVSAVEFDFEKLEKLTAKIEASSHADTAELKAADTELVKHFTNSWPSKYIGELGSQVLTERDIEALLRLVESQHSWVPQLRLLPSRLGTLARGVPTPDIVSLSTTSASVPLSLSRTLLKATMLRLRMEDISLAKVEASALSGYDHRIIHRLLVSRGFNESVATPQSLADTWFPLVSSQLADWPLAGLWLQAVRRDYAHLVF